VCAGRHAKVGWEIHPPHPHPPAARLPCLSSFHLVCMYRHCHDGGIQVAANSVVCNLAFAKENRALINAGSGAVLIRVSPLRVPAEDERLVQQYVTTIGFQGLHGVNSVCTIAQVRG